MLTNQLRLCGPISFVSVRTNQFRLHGPIRCVCVRTNQLRLCGPISFVSVRTNQLRLCVDQPAACSLVKLILSAAAASCQLYIFIDLLIVPHLIVLDILREVKTIVAWNLSLLD